MAHLLEKQEMVEALMAHEAGDGSSIATSKIDPFMKQTFGAAAALSAEYEMQVQGMTVSELKTLLRNQGIDFAHVKDKADLVALALEGKSSGTHKSLGGEGQDVGEHLLEC